MRVAIVGIGYVGLVTAACLAAAGHRVVCADTDPDKVAAINRGETPIHEAVLSLLVKRGVAEGSLRATADLAEAMAGAALTMICVGTPSAAGSIDLTMVRRAAQQVGAVLAELPRHHVVAVKSTVVPGTTDTIVREALEEASGLTAGQFGLCVNPEFLSQGRAVADFQHPDRIVVGEYDARSGDVLAELYQDFPAPILRMGLRNAEMVKYAANSLQAALISFANQIASICERTPGADESVVMRAVHLDRLLAGPDGAPSPVAAYLRGGIGFGGSCFPKDLAAFRHFAAGIGADTRFLDGTIATNELRAEQVAALLRRELGSVAGRVIAVLGLAFKPHTDDIRTSPGLRLIERLEMRGAVVRAHDPLPQAMARARDRLGPRVELTPTPEAALRAADAAVIATAWPDYRAWDWPSLAAVMRTPLMLDGRNLFDGAAPPPGLLYRRIGVGRPLT